MTIPRIQFDIPITPMDKQPALFEALISSGQAFTNPVRTLIEQINAEVQVQITYLQSQAALVFPLVPVIPALDVASLITALQLLPPGFTALLTHTDFLSGVTMSTDINVPTLSNCINIGNNYVYNQAQKGLVDTSQPIEGVLAFFGALYNSDSALSDTLVLVTNLSKRIEAFILNDPLILNKISVPDALAGLALSTSSVNGLVAADVALYTAAKVDLLGRASLMNIVSGCLNPYIDKLYQDKICTPQAKEIVRGIF